MHRPEKLRRKKPCQEIQVVSVSPGPETASDADDDEHVDPGLATAVVAGAAAGAAAASEKASGGETAGELFKGRKERVESLPICLSASRRIRS